MKASEQLRIWIGDTKPEKEVKSWMDRLDRLEEQDFETGYWEAQQHLDMLYRKNGFGTQEFTDAAYRQYLAALEEQERRENEN